MKLFSLLSFFASIISIVPATYSLATYSTTSGGPSYSVGISASNSDNVYFQLAAPTSYQWVALGIGSQMSGSTIFVMYADGTGNVTLSPRKGTGQVEPKYDSSMTVELLSGSGIVDGNMVANVLCTSCNSKLSSTTSTSSNWIAAWNSGSALDTTDKSKSISQHSGSNHRSFTFDLSQAQLESDSNPFTSTSSATTSSSNGGSLSSSSSSVSGGSSPVQSYDMAHGIIMGVTVVLLFPLGALSMRIFGRPWLHATLQIFSFIFLIAGLGLGIRLAGLKYGTFGGSNVATRTVIDEIKKRQFGGFGSSTFTGTPSWATATGTYTGGFNSPTSTSDSGSDSGSSGSGSGSGAGSQGSGNAAITSASITPNLGMIITNTTHMIFGIILVVLFFIQPFLGLIHHWRYMRAQRRGMFGYIHLWYGRILIVLAVINGGLGLQLASNTKNGEIAYGIIAAFMGLFYIGVVVFTAMRKRRRNRDWSKSF
ncbi:hypothetical protein EAF04_005840 [Stromatinia cepivora]|nr:hypothetical protein EAF04_005840 [Stromatinia cepivora]